MACLVLLQLSFSDRWSIRLWKFIIVLYCLAIVLGYCSFAMWSYGEILLAIGYDLCKMKCEETLLNCALLAK